MRSFIIQFKVFLREIAIFTSTLVIKRKIALEFGGFDETLLRHQDLQFLVDAANVTEFEVLDSYLVKLHTDSEINKPNVEKLIKTKKEFFEAEKDKIGKFNKCDQKRIRNAHYYEIVFSALKAKNIKTAIKYTLKAGVSFLSLKDLYKRFRGRTK